MYKFSKYKMKVYKTLFIQGNPRIALNIHSSLIYSHMGTSAMERRAPFQ